MMKTNIQRKGELFVFLGALFWSLNAPLIKFISLDAMLVCGLRSLIAGVALLPFLFRSKLRFSKGMLVYLIDRLRVLVPVNRTRAAADLGGHRDRHAVRQCGLAVSRRVDSE